MTDSAKCCCAFAFCAMANGPWAFGEDHGSGGGSGVSGSPVVRPVASDTDRVKTTFGDFAKSLGKGAPTTTAEKEKAAFEVLRVECGSCHGPGRQFSSPAVFRVGKDGRPLDPNSVTYLRVMLSAVQNAGKIMPPDEKLSVEDKRTLAAWLATEGVFPRRYRNPQDIPRPVQFGSNRERPVFARDRIIGGGNRFANRGRFARGRVRVRVSRR